MPVAMTRHVRLALIGLGIAGCPMPAHAADVPFSIGAVYAYGDNVDVYGIQGVWVPRFGNDVLRPHGFEFRVSSQLGVWDARDNYEHSSLTYGNLLAETRYVPWRSQSVQPFVELGFGVHLNSHTQIANHNLATAFNFGSQGALGMTFGDEGRYEVAAFIYHASNARIKQPNQGLTYSGIRLRMALPSM